MREVSDVCVPDPGASSQAIATRLSDARNRGSRRAGKRVPAADAYSITRRLSFSVSSLYRLRIVTSVTPATSATSRWVRRSPHCTLAM